MSDWSDMIVPEGWQLEIAEEVDSTNEELKRRDHVASGTVLVAERQTEGRGRRGNSWLTMPGDGLTFSVLLRPEMPRARWPDLALTAGLAITRSINQIGPAAEVKWPNDVMIGGRKVSGILVEAAGDAVIIGIGINVGTQSFPQELEASATSLHLEGYAGLDLPDLLSIVLHELSGWVSRTESDFPDVIRAIREQCALTGHRVILTSAGAHMQGVVEGIGDRGELLLRTPDELHALIQADEVRILAD